MKKFNRKQIKYIVAISIILFGSVIALVPSSQAVMYRQLVMIDNVVRLSNYAEMIVDPYSPDVIFRSPSDSWGNEGMNLILVSTDVDGVPSFQLMLEDQYGNRRLMTSFYNDNYNTVYATWQEGHFEEHYTYSEINPNTVSRKSFIGSGDKANSGFTNVKFFQIFSDNGETETFAVNGQTGEIYAGNIAFRNNFSNIGDMINYVKTIYTEYSLQNVLRPLSGDSIAIQDINGVPRFEFTDLNSVTDDFTLRPTIPNTGNLGTRDAPWRASFIKNLEIQNAFYLVDPITLEIVAEINESGFFLDGEKMIPETEFQELETKIDNICRELQEQEIILGSC